jgi:hypothetical protein
VTKRQKPRTHTQDNQAAFVGMKKEKRIEFKNLNEKVMMSLLNDNIILVGGKAPYCMIIGR